MLHLFFQVKIEVWSWARTLHTSPGVMQSPTPSLPLLCYLIYECSLNKTVIDNQSIWQYYPILLESFFTLKFPFWVWFKCSVVFVSLKFSNFRLFKCCCKKEAFRCTWITYCFFDTSPLNKVFHPPAKMIFQLWHLLYKCFIWS